MTVEVVVEAVRYVERFEAADLVTEREVRGVVHDVVTVFLDVFPKTSSPALTRFPTSIASSSSGRDTSAYLLPSTLLLEAHLADTLGVLADLVGVEAADLVHVSPHIARGEHLRSEATALARVVQVAQHDRHLRLSGDVIEAGLPVVPVATRALWRNRQSQGF